MADVKILGPEILGNLFEKILGPLSATQVGTLLHEPENMEDRVNLLTKTFEAHPHLILPFRNLIKSMHAQETEISIEEQIRFFTTKHTRYYLLVNLMERVLRIKELALDEATGRMPAKPADLMKYANQAKEAFGEESRYRDFVFSAGLMYDFVLYLSKSKWFDNPPKIEDWLDQAYQRSVEQGVAATKIGKHKAKLSLEKYVPSTIFLRNLAPVCLILIKPTHALEFYKKYDPRKTSEPLRLALERETFGIHSGMIAAYLGHTFPIFDHVGEAMSVWGFPFLSWASGKRDIHDLSGMGATAVHLLERVRGGPNAPLGPIGNVIPELSNLEFDLTVAVKNEIKI